MTHSIMLKTDDFQAFVETYTTKFEGSEISYISGIIEKITRIIRDILDLFSEKVTLETGNGPVRLCKYKVLSALTNSSAAHILSSTQYQVAQKLKEVVNTSLTHENFKPALLRPSLSDSQKFHTFLQLPQFNLQESQKGSILACEEPSLVEPQFYLHEKNEEPSQALANILQEIETMLQTATVHRAFMQKLPSWEVIVENIIHAEIGDFFTTNGDHLTKSDIATKIVRLSSYIASIDQICQRLQERYSSISWLQSVLFSAKTTEGLKEFLLQFYCFKERLTILKSCLEYKESMLSPQTTSLHSTSSQSKPRNLCLGHPAYPTALNNPQEIRVLAARGGGIKGLVSTKILKSLEDSANEDCPEAEQKPIGDRADILTGTSTGAIIAGLASLGHTAQEIDDLYTSLGDHIFEGQESKVTNFVLEMKRLLWQPKYERGTRLSLHKTGRAYLEEQARRLANRPFGFTKRELAIPFCSSLGEAKKERTVLITSEEQRKLYIANQYLLSDVILASTSANTFFPNTHLMTIETLVSNQDYMRLRMFPDSVSSTMRSSFQDEKITLAVDGGCTSNDPTSLVYDTYDLPHREKRAVKIITIGTGKNPKSSIPKAPLSTNISALEQIPLLIDGIGTMLERDIKSRIRLFETQGHVHTYLVLNPTFSIPIAIDSIRLQEKQAMKEAGEKYVAEDKKQRFSRAVEALR